MKNESRLELLRVVCSRPMLTCCLLGFASGLPLYVLLTLLQVWLRREGVGLAELGLITGLVQWPYSIKFLWAPLLDALRLPFLGPRRGWMLVMQLGLLGAIAAMGLAQPSVSLSSVSAIAVVVSLFSATQDIAINSYTRELLRDHELGLGNSLSVQTYRLSQLVISLGLIVSGSVPWSAVFAMVAAFMAVGILGTLIAPSIDTGEQKRPSTYFAALWGAFMEFVSRKGVASAGATLAFMFLYKFGDATATALLNAFYVDVGFSNEQIGAVAKVVGLVSTVAGGLGGGLIMVRTGINRALWIFGFVQLASILGFTVLLSTGPDLIALGVVVAFEYLGVGLGSAAFVAFMAQTASRRFAATQMALFTGLIGLPRMIATSSAGYLVEQLGYRNFFYLCALFAIPGMVLLVRVAPWNSEAAGSGSPRPS